jgi:transcriptional regulator with XRE-family HTH domain
MINKDELLYREIGEQLKRRRIDLGLTQAQLAEKIGGVRRTSITNIEAGRQHPPLSVLYDLCYVLGLEIIELLPTVAEIKQHSDDKRSDYISIEIEGKVKNLPPKSARLVQELMDE